MKILLPVDGSVHTKHMLAHLAAHDELLGGGHTYTVFTAVTPVPPYAARVLDHSTVEDYYLSQANEVLKPVMAFAAQQGWNVSSVKGRGPAAEAIAAFAVAEKMDLIVMGTHGHSALGNVLLGSVASGVLARCTVPVMLIR